MPKAKPICWAEGGSNWSYALVPIARPTIGGSLAGLLLRVLGSNQATQDRGDDHKRSPSTNEIALTTWGMRKYYDIASSEMFIGTGLSRRVFIGGLAGAAGELLGRKS